MRNRLLILTSVVILSVLCACNVKPDAPDPDAFYVYDLSADMTHIEPCVYEPVSDLTDVSESVGMLLQRLIDGPSGGRLRSAIPNEITSVTYIIGSQTVGVNFDGSYDDIPQDRKLLCEAAVVRTLCSLDSVYAVSFSVEGQPLCDSQGIPVGLLTPDSFVENDGAMINAYERAELHLFFADESGQKLVEKAETVTYNSNISMDRLVVENIIQGPRSTDAFATINPATVVNSVTTRDGVCYVNLSKDYLNKITNVTDKVMLYSIVNSLTRLGNINKVQILIDGETNARLGEIELSKLFERNLEMID